MSDTAMAAESSLCGVGADCENACPFLRRGFNCPTVSEARAIAKSQGRTLGDILRQVFSTPSDSASAWSTTSAMSSPSTMQSSLR